LLVALLRVVAAAFLQLAVMALPAATSRLTKARLVILPFTTTTTTFFPYFFMATQRK
jgi:hypothetical protein